MNLITSENPRQGGRPPWLARVTLLLLIEFVDEFVFGVREAAWPLIRTDLGLDYVQIGVLLGLPGLLASGLEPFIGILGDVWKRRFLILGGGLVFALALLLTGLSSSFVLLLFSFLLFYPASGAFVSLSQATLMDLEPRRHEQNMARWTLAGSIGVVAGPIALGGAAALALGWRSLFLALAGFSLALVVISSVFSIQRPQPGGESSGFRAGARQFLRALRHKEVVRWLILLEFSNLMLDVLLGFLALYFVDVAGLGESQAALAVAIWTGASLVGDLLIIPLLERVRGLSYLRLSAVLELVLYVSFLIAPGIWAKVALLGLLGFFNAGWYAVLMAQLYSTLPGRSGTAMAVNSISASFGSLLPFVLGFVAERFGLRTMMWLLLLGPLALLVGLPPRPARSSAAS